MMSTWNKFCFTGGYIEASVVLPGVNNILGLWPAIWTMGNLGRAGYGASLEGTVGCLFEFGVLDPHIYLLSGPIHTTNATSVRWQIKLSMANPQLRL